MGAFVVIAAVLVASTVLVAFAFRRMRAQGPVRRGLVRNALRFIVGPFPLSVAIHVLIALFLIITVHESRGRELFMVNLEAGGGGGSEGETADLDVPDIPVPDVPVETADQPISSAASSVFAMADSFARSPNGIGTGLGPGIGSGRGPGIGPGFGGYIATLRRKGFDVALVIDGTGSMEFVIADVKARMNALATAIHRLVPVARVGIIVYGGKGEPVEMQPLTLSPSKLKGFLNGIQAKGGGEWEENVSGAIETAVDKMDWKPYAKKVIVLVADSPPEKADYQRIVEIAHRFRAGNGTLNAIDLSELEHQRFEAEFDKRVHGGIPAAPGDASKAAALPAFYRETQIAYAYITREGGGEMRSLASNEQLNQEVMVLAFGSKWRDTISSFARR